MFSWKLWETCAVIAGTRLPAAAPRSLFTYDGTRPELVISSLPPETCAVTATVECPSFLDLTPNCRPVAVPSRRYSVHDSGFMESEVKKLYGQGIVRPSNSPWRAQPIVVANKEIGKKSLCIDYSQAINLFTVLDAYPLPKIDEIVRKSARNRVFSTFDLSSYNQWKLREDEKAFTAFEAAGRLWEYNSLPFGVYKRSLPTNYGFDCRFRKTSWRFSLLGQHNSWRNDASWTRSERATSAPCSQSEEHDIKCNQNDLLGIRSKHLGVPCRLRCDQARPGAIEAAAWTAFKCKAVFAVTSFHNSSTQFLRPRGVLNLVASNVSKLSDSRLKMQIHFSLYETDSWVSRECLTCFFTVWCWSDRWLWLIRRKCSQKRISGSLWKESISDRRSSEQFGQKISDMSSVHPAQTNKRTSNVLVVQVHFRLSCVNMRQFSKICNRWQKAHHCETLPMEGDPSQQGIKTL